MCEKRKFRVVFAKSMICTIEVEAEDPAQAEETAGARLDRLFDHVPDPVMPCCEGWDFRWGEDEVIDVEDVRAEMERLRADLERQPFETDWETGERFLCHAWFGFPAGTAKRVVGMWLRGDCSWESAYRLATM